MMTTDELKEVLSSTLTEPVFAEGGEWLTLHIEPNQWPGLAQRLQQDEQLQFDFLFCLTCIDWKTQLEMVYHITSTKYRHTLVVKVKLDAANPVISTCSNIWKTALFHEREVYEMFGVQFDGHPDLRLLILPDGWEGRNPLRKDFDDPVNMIRL